MVLGEDKAGNDSKEEKEDGEGEEVGNNEVKDAKPVARIDLSTMSDLDELVLCRSANQIKVCVSCLSLLRSIYPYRLQETMKEYENIASANLLETIKMEFSELKAEAYSSLSMCY